MRGEGREDSITKPWYDTPEPLVREEAAGANAPSFWTASWTTERLSALLICCAVLALQSRVSPKPSEQFRRCVCSTHCTTPHPPRKIPRKTGHITIPMTTLIASMRFSNSHTQGHDASQIEPGACSNFEGFKEVSSFNFRTCRIRIFGSTTMSMSIRVQTLMIPLSLAFSFPTPPFGKMRISEIFYLKRIPDSG